MRGGKALDGKKVELRFNVTTKGGMPFSAGDLGTFHKRGVVRCVFTRTSDGACLDVSRRSPHDFHLLGDA